MNVSTPFVPCGDLVLCRGGTSSTLIIAAQKVMRWRRRISYSHVGMELGGFILHAVPRHGVHLQSTLEFMTDPKLRDGWRVYRHASLGEPNDFGDVIRTQALHYLRQRYNMAILVPKRWFRRPTDAVDPSSFCSELVAKVLENTPAGMAMNHRSPTSTLPADLETLMSSADWLDVTAEYIRQIDELRRLGDRAWQRRLSSEKKLAEMFVGLADDLARDALIAVDVASSVDEIAAGFDRSRQPLRIESANNEASRDDAMRAISEVSHRALKADVLRKRLRRRNKLWELARTPSRWFRFK